MNFILLTGNSGFKLIDIILVVFLIIFLIISLFMGFCFNEDSLESEDYDNKDQELNQSTKITKNSTNFKKSTKIETKNGLLFFKSLQEEYII